MQQSVVNNMSPSVERSAFIRDAVIIALIFFALIILYAYTAPRTIALEDDGLFVLASNFLGIAHPPGYPLHTLIGKLFTLLPFGSVAYRVHLMSAFFGALACVFLYLCVKRVLVSHIAAALSAFAFGLSHVFWSQSIIAEVYSLNACLFFILCYLILRVHPAFIRESDNTDSRIFRHLLLIAFIYGLSLSNHWPLIGLSTPGLLMLLWPRRTIIMRHIIVLVIVAIAGLLPYLWLVVRSQMNPSISFYGPITSWEQFWFMVSRKGYSAADASQTADIADKVQYLVFFMMESGRQFLVAGTVLVLIGFVAQWRMFSKSVASAFCLIALCNSILLIMMLKFDYEYLQKYVFMVYPILSYGVMAIWLGLGAYDLTLTLSKVRLIKQWAWPAIFAVVLVPSFYYGFKQLDRHEYQWSRQYAKSVFKELPEKAILFAKGDVDFGTLAYYHVIENYRPDITLLNPSGLVLNNRLFHPLQVKSSEYNDRVVGYVNRVGQEINFTRDKPAGFRYIHHWLYQTVSPDYSTIEGVLSADQIDFFKSWVFSSHENDPWTIFFQSQLKQAFAAVLAMSMHKSENYNDPQIIDMIEKFKTDYYTCIGFVEGVFIKPQVHSIITVGEMLKSAQKLYPEVAQKSDKAKFYELLAYYNIEIGDTQAAVRYLNASIDIWPGENNRAVDYLLKLYKKNGQNLEYEELKNRIHGGA